MGTIMSSVSKTTDAGANAYIKTSITATSVPENRAYLLSTDLGGVTQAYLQTREFITGVDEIDATENGSKAVMYNLSGTRANTLQKGHIYATSDGKTVLVQ